MSINSTKISAASAQATGVADGTTFTCSIFEHSQSMLGIVSNSFFAEGSQVELNLGRAGSFPVQVEKNIGFAQQNRNYCYRVRCLDAELDLEAVMPELLQRTPGQSTRLQFIRFTAPKELLLTTKTFGSSASYRLRVDNLSKSGLLLDTSPSPGMTIPFCEGTLLELELRGPEDERIQLLGKVTRCQYDQSSRVKRLGVSLSELSQDMVRAYHGLVNSFEKSTGVPYKTAA